MKYLCKKNIFFLSIFSICSVHAVEHSKNDSNTSVLKKRTHIESNNTKGLNSSPTTKLFLFEEKKDEKGIASTDFADIASNNANKSGLNTIKAFLIRVSEKGFTCRKKKAILQAKSIFVMKKGSNGNNTYTVCQTDNCHFDYENSAEKTEYYAMVEVCGHDIMTNPDVQHIEVCDQRMSNIKYAEDQAINHPSGVSNSEKKEKSEYHSLFLISENNFDLFKKRPSSKIKKRRAKKNTNEYSEAKNNPNECNDLKNYKPSAESRDAMFENKEFKNHESNNEFNELFEHEC